MLVDITTQSDRRGDPYETCRTDCSVPVHSICADASGSVLHVSDKRTEHSWFANLRLTPVFSTVLFSQLYVYFFARWHINAVFYTNLRSLLPRYIFTLLLERTSIDLKMTKLMEWLLFATAFIGVWTAAITGTFQSSLINEWRNFILLLPIILFIIFGLYATIVILYRVFTFNNCEAAAKELQRQIEEAKAELRIKGILS